jgi:hypothetical protein
MDDLSTLRDKWSDAEPPSPAVRDRARAALLTRIGEVGVAAPVRARTSLRARTRFMPAWVWRSGIATAAAATLAAGLLVALGPMGSGSQAGRPSNSSTATTSATTSEASQTLELAAVYAAAQPFTKPRPDQWAYIELRISTPDPSKSGALSVTLRKSWYRLDGTQIATLDGSGHITITTDPEDVGRVTPKPALNPHDYPTLVGMPSDPQAVLTFLRAGLEQGSDPDPHRSGQLFGLIGYILRENVLPPDITAALLRAAAVIPGVTQLPGTITADGHPAIAVGRVDGWAREEILLDPVSKEFLGSRNVAVADQPMPVADQPMPAPQTSGKPGMLAPGPLAKTGDVQYLITRANCVIVNTPGQTR